MQEVDLARSHELGAEAEASSAEQRVEAAGSRYQSALANLVHETAARRRHSTVQCNYIITIVSKLLSILKLLKSSTAAHEYAST